jgi:hypothetical protein
MTDFPLPPQARGGTWVMDSCPAAGHCFGVGEFSVPGFAGRALIEQYSAGMWSALEAPAPPQGGFAEALIASSCTAVDRCAAVGSFSEDGDVNGLIETLAGGEWVPTEAPLPVDASSDRFADLYDVSCTAALCVAIGRYSRADNHEIGLIETGVRN